MKQITGEERDVTSSSLYYHVTPQEISCSLCGAMLCNCNQL